ncbi:MAG: hypothetical protein FD133_810 [Erysipelotrichaceae bacterium]|nr:MAG: hypothetical protein FD179_1975 [Erysipelotrichaceae bacterium]TXT18547.1 MAG: hypothetical protein FD133_810 [Erysipelotrichaceae bacterium]
MQSHCFFEHLSLTPKNRSRLKYRKVVKLQLKEGQPMKGIRYIGEQIIVKLREL